MKIINYMYLRKFTFPILLCISMSVFAFDFCEDGLYYSIVQDGSKNKVLITCKSIDSQKNVLRQGKLTIPTTVTHKKKEYTVIGISGYALSSTSTQTGYTSVIIPEGIAEIRANAFSGYLGEKIELPSTISYIDHSAFVNTPNLKTIIINENNKYFFTEDGILFRYSDGSSTKEGCTLIAYPQKRLATNYTIPTYTASIGEKAFLSCKNLRTLTITSAVKTIGAEAFSYAKITSYEFESKATVTDGLAFGISPNSDPITIVVPKGTNLEFTLKLKNAKVKYTEDIEWENLVKKAERGDKVAMRTVAKKYAAANDDNSVRIAYNWYQKAAEAGDLESQKTLAEWYHQGRGKNVVLRNNSMYFYWIEKAAAQNDAEAQYKLSECYRYGTGTTKNAEKAFTLCKLSAEQNYVPAQAALGDYYRLGIATDKDQTQAMHWYGLAAGKGNKSAQKEYDKLLMQGYHEQITVPAMLNIVEGSLQFVDANGNRAIDADETCYLKFKVRNDGKGDGYNCKANVKLSGQTDGIKTETVSFQKINAGETREVSIPIVSDINTKDGILKIEMTVDEASGFGTQPIEITATTKSYNAPHLQVVDFAAQSDNGSLSKGRPFSLQLLLQNTQSGRAENVEVKMIVPQGVFVTSENVITDVGELNGGAAKTLQYELIASNNYSPNNIPVKVLVKERYGKFAENKDINLMLNSQVASTSINLTPTVEINQPKQDIAIASIGSDVDKNIPSTNNLQPSTFVVIIANENYQTVANVPYALNDGRVFAQYCEMTLGIPHKNIHIQTNATLNIMRREINWLSQVMEAYKGEAKVIFYYAGHGIPDEKTRSSYLLPIDGYGTDISTGYKLDNIYSQLAAKESQSVTVIIDACFSGTKREGDMLASARGIAIKSKPSEPQGKMVVFTAATDDETAYPYNEQGHGMFTYYLLKKLQETQGDVTYEELGRYITEQVSRQSIVENGKSQTPTINAATQAVGWKEWKLK